MPNSAASLVFRGVRSAAALRLIQLAAGLVSVAVLARLLGPVAYGAFGLAMSILAICQLVSNVWGGAYVATSDASDGDFDAMAWMSMATGLAGAALLVSAAPWIARVEGFAGAAEVLPVLAIALLIGGPVTFLVAEAQRQRRFDLLAQSEVASAGVGLVAGIAMALSGYGVWSLVGMELTRHVVRLTVLIVRVWRAPRWRCRKANLLAMLRFDGARMAGRFLQWADQALPLLVVARLFGAEALGFYVLGWTVFSRIKEVVVGPFAMFAMPAVSAARRDTFVIRQMLGTWQRLSVFITYPVILGFVIICPILVAVWLGPKWEGVAIVMQILVLSGLRSASSAFNGAVMEGMGRPGLQLRVYAAGLIATVALLPLGAMAGLAGIATAVLIRGWLTWPIGAVYVERLTAYPALQQFRVAVPALLMSGVMVLIVLGVQMMWPPATNAWPLLIASVAIGAAVYLVGARLWMRDSLLGVIDLIQGKGSARMAMGSGQ